MGELEPTLPEELRRRVRVLEGGRTREHKPPMLGVALVTVICSLWTGGLAVLACWLTWGLD